MNHDIPIHTTVPRDVHKKLMRYGGNILKQGIIKAVELAEHHEKYPIRKCSPCSWWQTGVCALIEAIPTNAEHCDMFRR
jgi:hypothetical protein